IDIAARLGRRALLLTRFRELLPASLPSHARHFDYAPFSRVLPQATALVHHGGIGTTAQAFATGVPQLVVPFAFDQPDTAARVRRLGVGSSILPSAFTGERGALLLRELLESS